VKCAARFQFEFDTPQLWVTRSHFPLLKQPFLEPSPCAQSSHLNAKWPEHLKSILVSHSVLQLPNRFCSRIDSESRPKLHHPPEDLAAELEAISVVLPWCWTLWHNNTAPRCSLVWTTVCSLLSQQTGVDPRALAAKRGGSRKFKQGGLKETHITGTKRTMAWGTTPGSCSGHYTAICRGQKHWLLLQIKKQMGTEE